MQNAPTPIEKYISTRFINEEKPPYTQLATVNAKGNPSVRTVHPRWFQELGEFAFACAKHSKKVSHLIHNKKAAFCFYDSEDALQIRWTGKLSIITRRDPLREKIWNLSIPELRAVYLKETKDSKTSLAKSSIPSEFIVIKCKPTQFSFLKQDQEDYTKTTLTHYVLKQQKWVTSKASIISGRVVKNERTLKFKARIGS